MQQLRTLLPLVLLCLVFTSCVEDTTETIVLSEPDVTEPAALAANQFRLGSETVDLPFGYVFTEHRPNEEAYLHRVVLTSDDVHENGDLAGSTPHAVEIVLRSRTAAVAGVYTEVAGSDGNRVQQVGYMQTVNFSQMYGTVAYRNYDASRVEITETDGILSLTIAATSRYYVAITGNQTTGLRPVDPDAVTEPVTFSDADFAGPNAVAYGTDETPITNAYLTTNPGRGSYELFLSTSPVDIADGELVGRGDAVMIRFVQADEPTTGRYDHGVTSGGYFSSLRGEATGTFSAFCRNINYVTNTMDDDETMDDGEALVEIDGDQVRISFVYQSRRHPYPEVSGTFVGPLERVRN